MNRVIARALSVTVLLLVAGCGSGVYVPYGFSSGDTFHIPTAALTSKSPQVQSWIAYSLAHSTCQIGLGGQEPSQNRTFGCELRSRRILAERWVELAGFTTHEDRYLDTLADVNEAGLLHEYVWQYHRQRDWARPGNLDMSRFDTWRHDELRGHRPQTRLIGYWAYAAR